MDRQEDPGVPRCVDEDARKPDALAPSMRRGEQLPAPLRAAGSHGGQSGAEDSTRTAGYVVDFETKNARPPGPTIGSDPRLLDGSQQPDATSESADVNRGNHL
jgi:hypothetical protein